jgi:uncharacterized protein YdaU (DUF1376 family)
MAKRKSTRKKKKLEPEEKAKLPYIPLYTGDYIKDTRDLSLEAKGAWSDMILFMWSTGSKGVLVGTVDDFTRRVGSTSAEQTLRILTELALKKVADVAKDDNTLFYTVSCRRLVREARISEARTKAVQNRYKSATKPVTNGDTKSVQNPEDENEYDIEVDNDDESELFGKCENFFHGEVPDDLLELVKTFVPMPDAGQWQNYVQREIEKVGYTVKREQPCPYISKEGKQINGRIDLVAGDGENVIGIELDYRQPRLKSIRKVETFDIGMVLLRDPKPVQIASYQLKGSEQSVTIEVPFPSKSEIEDEIFNDARFMESQRKNNPGVDIKKAFLACWDWHMCKPSPPVHAWEWKQKLISWLTINNNRPTKKKTNIDDIKLPSYE